MFLSRADRATVDADLAPRAERLGDQRLVTEARRLAYALDPAGFVARQRNAESERRVSLRPAPDTMAWLGALLPAAQGVAAAHAQLGRDADALRAAGDPRTRGQVMADLLADRLTGRAAADGVPVEVTLVVSTDTLLENGAEPGQLAGYGPVPAPTAREMALSGQAPLWLGGIFTSPSIGRHGVPPPAVHPRPAPLGADP